MGETLPSWMVVIYYLFLLVTFFVGIMFAVRNTINRVYSLIAVVSIPIIFVIFFIKSLQRIGVNEFEHWVSSLFNGEVWSWLIFILLIYTIIWWGLVIMKLCRKQKKNNL